MFKLDCEPMEVNFDESTNYLFLGDKRINPKVRTIDKMAEVVYDRQYLARAPRRLALYYIYRKLRRRQEAKLFEDRKLTYEVLVIPPAHLGLEYAKTLGHYHKNYPNSTNSFPEVYEVMIGECIFLIQKRVGESPVELEDVVAIKAEKGDKVVMPIGYGHVIINPTMKLLVTSNLRFEGEFDDKPFIENGGGAYYYVEGGEWRKNVSIKNAPELKQYSAKEWPASQKIAGGKNLYADFIENPGKYEFLLKA